MRCMGEPPAWAMGSATKVSDAVVRVSQGNNSLQTGGQNNISPYTFATVSSDKIRIGTDCSGMVTLVHAIK